MRPLRLKPKCAVTRLAFSPDGRLVVGQGQHGIRVIDPAGGAELSHVPVMDSSYRREHLPSRGSRHTLYVSEWDLRFGEAACGGGPFEFQQGWVREKDLGRPPAEPVSRPFEASRWYTASITHFGELRGEPRVGPGRWRSSTLLALSGDHRFAVGGQNSGEPLRVFDLAREAVLVHLGGTEKASNCRARFTPDGRRVVVNNPEGVSFIDLPPEPAAEPEPPPPPPAPRRGILRRMSEALMLTAPPPFTLREGVWPKPLPTLAPAVMVTASKPQPDTEPVPFALLPCGRRMIVRGIKSRVELRDVTTGEVLTVWKWRLSRLLSLAVSADGLTAAAGGTGGQMMLWDLE